MWDHDTRATRRRTAQPRPAPRGEATPGRVRSVRCLGTGRGGRAAHLLRHLRPAAPRPGVRRHRGQQRPPDPRLQGHGAGLPGLRRPHTVGPARAHRGRQRALRDHRGQLLGERAAHAGTGRCRHHGPGAHGQPHQHPPPHGAGARADRAGPQGPGPAGPAAAGTAALGHNGNLTYTRHLMELVREQSGQDLSGEAGRGSSTDTAVITALLAGAPGAATKSLEQTAMEVLPQLEGAFSLVFMDEHSLYAARDRHGFRPLVLGRLQRGWAIASETAALDIVGATFVREVEPGELVVVDEDGLRSQHFASADPRGCVFEYVYLARPDTQIAGRSVNAARTEMGRVLAREHPVNADLVIPTPDSGTPAAIGYAQERSEEHTS